MTQAMMSPKEEANMRRFIVAAAVCALVGLGAALGEDAAREKEVRAVTDAFVAAWNKDDSRAMAAEWAPDGDLINPFGRWAKGRAEVEKLFADEHSTAMKGSTYALSNYQVRFPSPAIACADWDGEITGMHNPDGSAMSPFKHHVNVLYAKKAGHWWAVAGRAAAFLPPPAAPSAPAKK
jgi:uncharacterized protein (TIGR02246 family)